MKVDSFIITRMILRKLIVRSLLKAINNRKITDLPSVTCRNFGILKCRRLPLSHNTKCKFRLTLNESVLIQHVNNTLNLASDAQFTRRCLCSKINGDGSKHSSRPIGQIEGKLMMSYKCKVCGTQNTETFSKQAYTQGVVIVTCGGCKGNHLIADHLGWFQGVEGKTIEEILASKGESVKRITVDGRIEMIPKEDEKE